MAPMTSLRKLRSFIAVSEEGSFTKAAARENATQSGVSQHISALERDLDVTLFDRSSDGVTPTAAGARYYSKAIEALRLLDVAAADARSTAAAISGPVRAGLMPAFTRSALAPALESFAATYPDVQPQIIEGYSGTLTDMVRAQDLDFALVPAFQGDVGLKITHLARDRECLVSQAGSPFPNGKDCRLRDLGPLNVIVPSPANTRRAKLDEYFRTHGATINRLIEMDAMLGTLGLIERSDWVAILPGVIAAKDRDRNIRNVAPIADPPLYLDFVVIEPARQPLSPQAEKFLDQLKREITAQCLS